MGKLSKTINANNSKVCARRRLETVQALADRRDMRMRHIMRARAIFWSIWWALVLAAVVYGVARFM